MLLNFDELYNKYNIKINGMIHIGSHYGQEYELYKKYNIKNMIFIEPLTDGFKGLKKNVGEHENVVLVKKALGNFEGEAEMNVASNGQSSSMLKPKVHLTQHPGITFTKTEIVDMTTLDNLMKTLQFKDYNFITIDVQGYELEVFKGGTETLNKIDYIMSEVNRDEMYEDCVLVDSLDDFLSKYKFRRVESFWPESWGWGDAFYIKE